MKQSKLVKWEKLKSVLNPPIVSNGNKLVQFRFYKCLVCPFPFQLVYLFAYAIDGCSSFGDSAFIRQKLYML